MPRGDKSKYTDKQKRQEEHIEEGYESRGVPHEEAEKRAWATVNKIHGGGKKGGASKKKEVKIEAKRTNRRRGVSRSRSSAKMSQKKNGDS